MFRPCLMITTIAVAIFMSGCHAIMTTAPLVNSGESCRLRLNDGIYTICFDSSRQCGSGSDGGADQSRASAEIDISYDATNRVYRIKNLANNDRFIAAAFEHGDGCYVSLTAEKPNLDELGLSEDERLFIVKGYVNFQLKMNEHGWGVFAMSSNEARANPILGYGNSLLKEYVFEKKQYPFKHVAELRRRDEADKKVLGSEFKNH